MTRYSVCNIGSKTRHFVEASSPAGAAYAHEGTCAPMELLPTLYPGVWRFRRFDAPKNCGFTVVVMNESLA